MVSDCSAFLQRLAITQPSNRELGVAAVWWHLTFASTDGLTVGEICRAIEHAGFAKQNRSRLRGQLASDGRTRKVTKERIGISVRVRQQLREAYREFVKALPVEESDSILPAAMFRHTRTYIERVVGQINASYDAGLYDCTAVMCRRLLETLIIEVYERQVRPDELKGNDGHFMMLAGLIDHLEADTTIHLGREAAKGLRAFKKLGDLSAHNRRFNARAEDIERVRDAVRVAAEELLHLAWPVATEPQ